MMKIKSKLFFIIMLPNNNNIIHLYQINGFYYLYLSRVVIDVMRNDINQLID